MRINNIIKAASMFILMLVATQVFAQDATIFGQWKTIDDETNEPSSIIEIYQGDDGKAYGKVLKSLRKDKTEKVCKKCDKKDKRYNQPIIGMEILEGLEKDSDTKWSDGDILDPLSGKVYSCNVELLDEDKLKVRGYIGFAMIGRTQYWYRVK